MHVGQDQATTTKFLEPGLMDDRQAMVSPPPVAAGHNSGLDRRIHDEVHFVDNRLMFVSQASVCDWDESIIEQLSDQTSMGRFQLEGPRKTSEPGFRALDSVATNALIIKSSDMTARASSGYA